MKSISPQWAIAEKPTLQRLVIEIWASYRTTLILWQLYYRRNLTSVETLLQRVDIFQSLVDVGDARGSATPGRYRSGSR